MTRRLPPSWTPPIAADQSGVFTVAQALAAGATPAQARHRKESGAWRRVVGDGYVAEGSDPTPWQRAVAVALTWPNAVVALRSAAALHGLPVRDDGAVHLIVPTRTRSRRGAVTHVLRLSPAEVQRRGPVRVTDLDRTLFDCIGRLPKDESEHLVAWAVTRELIGAAGLEAALRERPRWWGNTHRRRGAQDARSGTLSAAERRLRTVLRRGGVTGVEFDQRIEDERGLIGRADALVRDVRLVIEVDGFEHHARESFQRDRDKQNRLVAAGYTVLRFTWADLTTRPAFVVAQVVGVIERLRAGSGTDLRR